MALLWQFDRREDTLRWANLGGFYLEATKTQDFLWVYTVTTKSGEMIAQDAGKKTGPDAMRAAETALKVYFEKCLTELKRGRSVERESRDKKK